MRKMYIAQNVRIRKDRDIAQNVRMRKDRDSINIVPANVKESGSSVPLQTTSYLRKMAYVFVALHNRVIIPDLTGYISAIVAKRKRNKKTIALSF